MGTVGCDIYGTIASISALAEIWTLTLISMDRFQAIFHPLETEKRMKGARVSDIFSTCFFRKIVLTWACLNAQT